MSQEISAILDYMEKEKGIPRDVLVKAMETALLAASRRAVGPAKDLRVEVDAKSGRIRALAKLTVVEKVTIAHDQISLSKARLLKPNALLHEVMEVDVTPKDFGRIAAQVFKQTMAQTVRGLEKNMIFDEFKDRADQIITGTVRRFEKSDVIIDLGKFEAVMPQKERVPTEEYTVGERIRVYVKEVRNTTRGPEIILSRADQNFVKKLFQLEVSELNDGTVQIKAIAREPGYRTKLAVWSDNEKVDPVGACVGMRGARVKNIVRELNNEKVDLFKWSPNVRELVVEALKPAKLKNIEVEEATKRVRITADEENLSLAIGRRGQNARLTAKLTGWEIDIIREVKEADDFHSKMKRAAELLAAALGTDVDTATKVVMAGFSTPAALVEVEEDDFIGALPDVEPDTARTLRNSALALNK
jgi:N utilization substance protein A